MSFNENAKYKIETATTGHTTLITFRKIVSWYMPKEAIDLPTIHEMGLCCNLALGESRIDECGDKWTRIE